MAVTFIIAMRLMSWCIIDDAGCANTTGEVTSDGWTTGSGGWTTGSGGWVTISDGAIC